VSVCLFLHSLCSATVFSRLGPNLTCGLLLPCGWLRLDFRRGTVRLGTVADGTVSVVGAGANILFREMNAAKKDGNIRQPC